jgi:hypothetical protein
MKNVILHLADTFAELSSDSGRFPSSAVAAIGTFSIAGDFLLERLVILAMKLDIIRRSMCGQQFPLPK